MANKNHHNDAICDIQDLSRIFVKTLKDLSSRGKSLTFVALANELERNDSLIKLLALANDRRETLAKPILEDEITRLRANLEEKEDEQRRTANELKNAEIDLDREKDFFKRLFLALVSLSRTEENAALMPMLDEILDLIANGERLVKRDKALSKFRSAIAKLELSRGVEPPKGKTSLLSGMLGFGKVDPLKRMKKAALQSLDELGTIVGRDYAETIETLRERIETSDDIDYILSLRRTLLDVIEDFAGKTESEKERITGFIREIGDRLVALEQSLQQSSTDTRARLDKDLAFHDGLVSDLSNVRDSVNGCGEFDTLKKTVLSHLDKISDALSKKRDEYVIRIRDAAENNDNIEEHFKKVITTLQDKNKMLKEQSSRDPLTGVFNRRIFMERLAVEFERFHRYKTPFSLIFFDVDHFKAVNDTYGHDAGDRALKGIAVSTGSILRKVDVFARYGGEEFVVILYETDIGHSVQVAEKLRKLIEEAEFEYRGQVVPVTISLGVTSARESDESGDTIVARADSYLYRAKKEGRNRVISDLDAGEG